MFDHCISRRDFTRVGLGTAALAAAGALPALAAWGRPVGLEHAELTALRDAIGGVVRIRPETGTAPIEARIVAVVEHRRPTADSPYEQFSLLLEADRAVTLGQGQHQFEHPDFGASHLLSVPVLREIPDSAHAPRILHQIAFTRPARG